jgi:Zn-dependent peptidase ImmA (M78 family)
MQRGFKAYAGRTADALRREMDLSPLDRFEPFRACGHLGIAVYPFSALEENGVSLRHSIVRADGPVSAFSIILPPQQRVFFYNDTRARTRVVSDVSHEIAHALLFHPPHSLSDLRCSDMPAEAEDEAAHLAGILLVSDEAALRVACDNLDLEIAANMYGVSRDMMTYRINVSGARRRADRRRRVWRSRTA